MNCYTSNANYSAQKKKKKKKKARIFSPITIAGEILEGVFLTNYLLKTSGNVGDYGRNTLI